LEYWLEFWEWGAGLINHIFWPFSINCNTGDGTWHLVLHDPNRVSSPIIFIKGKRHSCNTCWFLAHQSALENVGKMDRYFVAHFLQNNIFITYITHKTCLTGKCLSRGEDYGWFVSVYGKIIHTVVHNWSLRQMNKIHYIQNTPVYKVKFKWTKCTNSDFYLIP